MKNKNVKKSPGRPREKDRVPLVFYIDRTLYGAINQLPNRSDFINALLTNDPQIKKLSE